MNLLKEDWFEQIIVPQVTELNFDNKDIKELPSLIIYKNLVRLHCNNNSLSELPKLPKNLKYLSVRNNYIEKLPSSLPQNLITLDLSYNKIQDLPKVLPPNLKILICNHNELKYISLSYHKRLVRFDCMKNNNISINSLIYNLPQSLLVLNKRKLYDLTINSYYGLRPIRDREEEINYAFDVEID